MEDVRRQRAIAQLDCVIDVFSAWSGQYADDDQHADIAWIMAVVPEMEKTTEYRRGWLCVSGTAKQGIGWELHAGQFRVCSLCRSIKGTVFIELTRKMFREAARKSGVSLPSKHATLYLDSTKGGS